MKTNILTLSFVLVFTLFWGAVSAQDDSVIMPNPTEGTDAITDEEIEAQDLEVGDPRLLPDSPIYFLKEWGRNIQSAFTFNTVAKAQLQEKFANEKLIELKKMVEQEKTSEKVEKALEKYQKTLENVEKATEKIKEKAGESKEVGVFLDKFIQHQTLHQRVLQKIEEEVPSEAFEKIEETRQSHLETFGQIITKLEENEQLQERLEKNLKEVKGSEFKEFKNLEILKELEEKVPEQAKEAIRSAQESSLNNVKEQLEVMPQEAKERFWIYTEEIAGAKEIHVEILETLEVQFGPNMEMNAIQSRDRIIEKIQEQEQEREQEREEEKTEACIQLWDPVCGANGKTYSNECFAKIAGVTVQYKGACQNVKSITPIKTQLNK